MIFVFTKLVGKLGEGHIVIYCQVRKSALENLGEGHHLFPEYSEGPSINIRNFGEGHMRNENFDRKSSDPPPLRINGHSLIRVKIWSIL